MEPNTTERKGSPRRTFTVAMTPEQREIVGQRAAEASHRAGRPISIGRYIVERAMAPLDDSDQRLAA